MDILTADTPQSVPNSFYDTSAHDLVKQADIDIPREEPKIIQAGFFKRLVGWQDQAPLDDVQKKKREIEVLEGKLNKLEERALATELLIQQAEPGPDLIVAKQNLIAIRQLLVEVKLEIGKGLREEYRLRFGQDHDKYKEIDTLVRDFEEHRKSEGQLALSDDAAFWGVKDLFNDLRVRRHEIEQLNNRIQREQRMDESLQARMANALDLYGFGEEEEPPPEPIATSSARATVIQDLQLYGIPTLEENLSPLQKAQLRVEELEGEVAQINDILERRGQFLDGGAVLSEKERAELKARRYSNEIELTVARAEVMKAQIAVKLSDLAKIRQTNTGLEEERELVDNIADLEERVASQMTRAQKLIMEQKAQEDVSVLLQDDKSYSQRVGNALGMGMDMLTNITSRVFGEDQLVPAKWQSTEWGALIADRPDGMFKQFSSSIAHFRSNVRSLQTTVSVMEKRRQDIQGRLDREEYLHVNTYPGQMEEDAELEETENYRGITAPEATRAHWEQQIATLEKAIGSAQAALDDSRIVLRAAFLERLIAEIGDRQSTLKAKRKLLEPKISMVNSLKKSIIAKEAQLEKRGHEFDAALREQMETSIRVQRENLLQLEQEVQQLSSDIQKLSKEVSALNTGYQLQREKYSELPRGQHEFMKQLELYFKDRLQELMTFGAVGAGYKPIKDFDLEFEFANRGYNWLQVLKDELESARSQDVTEFFKAEVKGFMQLMDDYPDLAKAIAVDFALTLDTLVDKAPLNMLLDGLRANAYTERALGSIGRDTIAPPLLTEEAYQRVAKYKALGDIAKWGPLAAATPSIIGKFGAGWAKGGLWSGLADAAVEAVGKGSKVVVTKNVIKAMDSSQQAVSIAVLAMVANGASPLAAIEEQRNLLVLELAGNAGRTLRDTGALGRGVRRFFKNQWQAYKAAGPAEKVGRVIAAGTMPVLGLGGAAAAVVFAAPLGLVFTGLLVFGSIGLGLTGGALMTRSLNFIPGYKRTNNLVRELAARDYAIENSNELKIARDKYVQQLQTRKVLAVPHKRRSDPPLLRELNTDQYLKPLEEEFKTILSNAMEQKKTTLKTRDAYPREVRDVFLGVVGKAMNPDATLPIHRKVKELVLANSPQRLSNEEVDEVVRGLVENLTDRLTDSWFRPTLDPAIENQFVDLVLNYQSPKQFDANRERIKESIDRQEDEMRIKIAGEVAKIAAAGRLHEVENAEAKLLQAAERELGWAQQSAAAAA
ncbi:MAG: hypothetical protein Q8K75_01215 [Chlamydiales bacterium]|nr:hypothetical protein [Chlamydiales bacterium]